MSFLQFKNSKNKNKNAILNKNEKSCLRTFSHIQNTVTKGHSLLRLKFMNKCKIYEMHNAFENLTFAIIMDSWKIYHFCTALYMIYSIV